MEKKSLSAFKELIKQMHFLEEVSQKIYGIRNEEELYSAINSEFSRSEKYTVGLLFLTEDKKHLKIVTSLKQKGLAQAEKITGIQFSKYQIDLEKSSIYRAVVHDGLTVFTTSREIMDELLPKAISGPVTKALGLSNNNPIIAPLIIEGKIEGALSINSSDLSEYFIPTVKALARHISQAAELIRERVRREEAEKKIEKMAYYDYLTGLPTRNLVVDRLEQAITLSRRNNSMAAIMMLDINKFKKINDKMGNDAGDQVLLEFSRRLKNSLRSVDTVGRMGVDEFMIILIDSGSRENIEIVAKKIIDALEKPYLIRNEDVKLDASIGIAVYPDDGIELKELILKSEKAMYMAKENNNKKYHFYNPKNWSRSYF